MLTNEYFPLLIQLVFALGFVVLVLVITHLIGPARKSAKKLENFECGIEAKGNARLPFSIKYFLTAILFLLLPLTLENALVLKTVLNLFANVWPSPMVGS